MQTVATEIKLFNWKNSWILMAFLAALAIHVTEAVYRLGVFETYFSLNAQATTLPFRLVGDFAVFWLFRRDWRGEAPSFITAWAVFIFAIITSRIVISTVHTHEPFNLQVLSGLVLLTTGLYLTMQRENSFWKIVIGSVLLVYPLLSVDIHGLSSLFSNLRLGRWVLFLLLSAGLIAVYEHVCRRFAFKRFFAVSTLAVLLPLDFFIGMGSFYGYREAWPSFMFAWGVYTVFDVVLRVINNSLLREPLRFTHALGMALVLVGTMFTYLGGR